jgi:hypothetical protein
MERFALDEWGFEMREASQAENYYREVVDIEPGTGRVAGARWYAQEVARKPSRSGLRRCVSLWHIICGLPLSSSVKR